jgi:hypothetical protein
VVADSAVVSAEMQAVLDQAQIEAIGVASPVVDCQHLWLALLTLAGTKPTDVAYTSARAHVAAVPPFGGPDIGSHNRRVTESAERVLSGAGSVAEVEARLWSLSGGVRERRHPVLELVVSGEPGVLAAAVSARLAREAPRGR